MPSKSVLARGFMAEAERISEGCRKDLGISKFDPLDAFKLAEHLQVDVFTVDEIFGDQTDHPDYSRMIDPDKFSAMWTPNVHGEKIIIHNDRHSRFRQQSNLMHELAHIIRKHTVPPESAVLCAQFGLHYFNPVHEQEAKYLGGCLQITRPGLQWGLKHLATVEGISDHFCASVDMVKYRIGITGVSKQYRFR
ncbi:Zn-dependent peptidase ImmA (M78 family) [Mucilaginibacter lappiensis]